MKKNNNNLWAIRLNICICVEKSQLGRMANFDAVFFTKKSNCATINKTVSLPNKFHTYRTYINCRQKLPKNS